MTERVVPAGWALASIGSLCTLQNGRAFKPTDWTPTGLPIVRIQNLNNPTAPFNRFDGEPEERFLIDGGDLLFAWSGTPGTSFGAHVWNGGRAVLNQHIFKVIFDEKNIDKEFFRLAINERLDALIGKAHGGAGLAHVTKGRFEETEVLVPPLNEQRRIVDKLDAIFERTRAARARLESIPAMLDQLRQSILAAAFRGDLTTDWREAHPDVEPASVLLERIRAERRRRWEEGLRAKGKDPKKATYEEPAPVDRSELPELPERWAWVRLPDLGELARGKSKHRPRNDERLFGDAVPFIQTGEVARSGGVIREWKAMYSPFGVAQSRVFRRGTVCITIAANIADSGILDFDACFPDSVVGLVVDDRLATPAYAENFIRLARADLARFAPATAQANINLEILGDVAVPLPPRQELDAITERLVAADRLAAAVAARAASALAEVGSAEAAALAKAFRGELVPQDPSDEPASVLLERIRAERAAEEPAKRGRGRPKAAAPAKQNGSSHSNGHGPAVSAGEPLDLVVAALLASGRATSSDVQTATGLDAAVIRPVLKSLERLGKVAVEGKARGTAYRWLG